MKNNVLKICFILFTLFSVYSQSSILNISSATDIKSENRESVPFNPEKVNQLSTEQSEIYVRTNVADAKVYLNGVYQGVSNLTIVGLKEGRYFLKVEKDGYKTEHFHIQVKSSTKQEYYVELKAWTGFVKIFVEPKNADVKIDSKSVSFNTGSAIELTEGIHKVSVKLFGYESLNDELYVKRDTMQQVDISLAVAQFDVSNFRANKKSFNPLLAQSLANCAFDFTVTNDGTAELCIKDFADNVVFVKEYESFNTWNQSFRWNGRSSDGKYLSDGVYTVILTGAGRTLTCQVEIDSSIKYSFAFPSADGLSIGNVASGLMNPSGTVAFYGDFGLDFTNKGDSAYAFPFEAGMNFNLSSWFNTGFWCGYMPKQGEDTFLVGCNVKMGGKVKGRNFNFVYGALFRAGGTKTDLFEPYGADSTRGVGGGIILGFEKDKLYASVLSEYLYNIIYDDELYDMDHMWRNGAVLQLRFDTCAYGFYGSLNSVFGEKKFWQRSVEAGVDIEKQFGKKPIFMSLSSGILYFIDCESKMYSKTKIGIQYLW